MAKKAPILFAIRIAELYSALSSQKNSETQLLRPKVSVIDNQNRLLHCPGTILYNAPLPPAP